MSTAYICKKAYAKMMYELEVEKIELYHCMESYDWTDKELVVAKRKADIALREFRVAEFFEKNKERITATTTSNPC